jgi:hypothetical protein
MTQMTQIVIRGHLREFHLQGPRDEAVSGALCLGARPIPALLSGVACGKIPLIKLNARTSMLQENLIREALAGYARANEVIENERMERLARMTPEQARAIYDELVETWWASASREGSERLDLWRAETLIAVRRAFEQLARGQGAL